ncbi:CHAP domain-containing protein [Paeniglutamicibacter sp. NPDC091659]|uniref:CHAP domain-containing protein n=1 Tax=Paeniglutamicibacter sp. NPDC091659 TaxID=3364389 RepID=UPI0037F9EE48
MSVAANADAYANERIGIYFLGHPSYLTGQCVAVAKWFIGEMCGIKDWQLARGHAKDFGDTLVRQGHAAVVSTPKRGDLVIWKQDAGNYGHIGVVLSGNRVFEANVGIAGTESEVFEGNKVYASRIDPLVASWRKGPATYYRLKSYKENAKQPVTNPPKGGDDMPVKINLDTARILTHGVLARNGVSGRGNSLDGSKDKDLKTNHVGRELTNEYVQELFLSGEGRQWRDTSDSNSIQGVNARLTKADEAAKKLTAEEAKSVGLVKNLDEQIKATQKAQGEAAVAKGQLETALDRIVKLESVKPPVAPVPEEAEPSAPQSTELRDVIQVIAAWAKNKFVKSKE